MKETSGYALQRVPRDAYRGARPVERAQILDHVRDARRGSTWDEVQGGGGSTRVSEERVDADVVQRVWLEVVDGETGLVGSQDRALGRLKIVSPSRRLSLRQNR
eukprot:442440-Rhodomonas_salina.1